jgi:hypothetical protein
MVVKLIYCIFIVVFVKSQAAIIIKEIEESLLSELNSSLDNSNETYREPVITEFFNNEDIELIKRLCPLQFNETVDDTQNIESTPSPLKVKELRLKVTKCYLDNLNGIN